MLVHMHAPSRPLAPTAEIPAPVARCWSRWIAPRARFWCRRRAAAWSRVPYGDNAEARVAQRRRLRSFRGGRDASGGGDGSFWAASSSHGACWCEPPAFRASSLLAVVASLPCTSTGSLVDDADTAALVLAAQGIVANDGADRPVAGARVLHRRGRLAAVAASVGVALRVPLRAPVAVDHDRPLQAKAAARGILRGKASW
jgi:hypothetical protein